MSNIYKSSKKGRQVDSAIDYIEKLPQKLTDIELSIKETNNNKADKVSIPKNLSDLIDDITQQNYDANSSSPQSGKAVAEAIAKLLGSAPENLDTLEELAKALNEDENFSATVLAELAAKADAKTVKGGFNGGDGAVAAAGGAIGGNAQAGFGGAVGRNTYTDVGGAVGLNAKANAGGAMGWNAKAGTGFSGGSNAIAGKDSEDNYIDAIQLGMGTNNKPKTLQVYDYTLMNEDGSIPEERLSKAKAYTDEKSSELSSAITTLENNEIECSSSGAVINIKDSAEVKPRGLKLYGKTIQGENPTPENPQELISIGDSGSVDVELYGKNLWDKEYASNKNNWRFLDNSYSFIAIYVGKGNTVTISYKNKLKNGLSFYFAAMTKKSLVDAVATWMYHSTVPDLIRNSATIRATEDYIYVAATMNMTGIEKIMEYVGNDLQIEISPSATSYESYKKKSISVSTPNGLPGIPVTSGGNYTDENGQQYICDEVDFARGKYVKRVGSVDLGTLTNWVYSTDRPNDIFYALLPGGVASSGGPGGLSSVMCSAYSPVSNYGVAYDETVLNGISYQEGYLSSLGRKTVFIRDNRFTSVASFIESVSGVEMQYILETPIETPLTDEEFEAYKSITMYKPVTNIFNSDNAQMKVDYVADTKTYVDNKFAELQNAIISTGGNV